jgi:lipoprotein-releasing system permease protein
VVGIATAGVSLGIALIILSLAIVQGFQHEVRELVVGFGSHVQLFHHDPAVAALRMDDSLQARVARVPGVRTVQPFFQVPGLVETRQDLKGVVVKGVGPLTDRTMWEEALVEGQIPGHTAPTGYGDSLCISVALARRLQLGLGDRVTLYLVGSDGEIRPRNVAVCGLYATGLQEYDERTVFMPFREIQRAARWGIEAQGVVEGGMWEVRTFGAVDRVEVEWSGVEGWEGPGPHDGSGVPVGSVVTAVVREVRQPARLTGDTVRFEVLAPAAPAEAAAASGAPEVRVQAAGGGWRFHATGYEVFLEPEAARPERLAFTAERIRQELPYDWVTQDVEEQSPEMFAWLAMLDLNVEIIIGLMVLISIINMASALLVIILERRPLVGMLKALGLSDGAVVRIFVWQATWILGRGFFWGNVLGLGLVGLQAATGWVRLDPAAYYVDRVPVRLDWMALGTTEGWAFLVCALSMLLPAYASARIRPAEAMRFR